jgi:7-keto-8-aminopelargonate synthetase-like enzyme
MKESAYLLNFGYQGIMSTIDALVTRNDIVYDDCHACIIDGVRLHSGKDILTTNDLESMEKICNVLQKWLLKQVVFCLLPKVFLECADNRVN